MKQKLTVGILFGGRTVEHEVSVKSAKNIYDAIDKDKYNVIRIGITKSGKWILEPEEADSGIVEGGTELAILPGIDSKIIVMDTMEKLRKTRCYISSIAWHLWRRWNNAGTFKINGHSLCRARSSWLCSWHG